MRERSASEPLSDPTREADVIEQIDDYAYNDRIMDWVYIEDIAAHDGQDVEIRGWVYNKRSSGKVRFLLVRDGTGLLQATAFSADKDSPPLPAVRPPDPGVLAHRPGPGPGRPARARRLRAFDDRARDRPDRGQEYPITLKEHSTPFLMEHRHLWLRSSKQHAVAARPGRGHQGRPRFLRRPGLPADGHPHPDAQRLRRDDDPVRDRVLRPESLPQPERPALQRGHGHGLRQGLLLRPDLPGREIEDPPPPHRVLDGRARGGLRHPPGHHRSRRGPHPVHHGAGPDQAAARARDARARSPGRSKRSASPFRA